jgi:hypothetical protein
MISIVICSRTASIPKNLEANIQETIGVSYEIISIDNSNNQYSIFEAYNIGVNRAQYDIICFMHDDILFYTNAWGTKIIQHFAQDKVGAVGVAGSAYYASLPGAWWSHGLIAQHIASPVQEIQYQSSNTNSSPVVVLDGVFICIKKSLFTNHTIRFDAKQLDGFHLYDVDISLQIFNAGYTLLSVRDIDLAHESTGVLNAKWLENVIKVQSKWSTQLPFAIIPMTYEQEVRAEYACLEEYSKVMRTNGISLVNVSIFSISQILKNRLKRFNIRFPLFFFKYTTRYLLKRLGVR